MRHRQNVGSASGICTESYMYGGLNQMTDFTPPESAERAESGHQNRFAANYETSATSGCSVQNPDSISALLLLLPSLRPPSLQCSVLAMLVGLVRGSGGGGGSATAAAVSDFGSGVGRVYCTIGGSAERLCMAGVVGKVLRWRWLVETLKGGSNNSNSSNTSSSSSNSNSTSATGTDTGNGTGSTRSSYFHPPTVSLLYDLLETVCSYKLAPYELRLLLRLLLPGMN